MFAAVVLATAGYCAGRLAVAWRRRRPVSYDVDATHVLMGTAMAGMLVPRLAFGPGPAWLAVFSAGTAWFGWQAVRSWRRGPGGRGPGQAATGAHALAGHALAGPAVHLLACAAMIYMIAAMPAGLTGAAAGERGMATAGGGAPAPVLAVLLTVALTGAVVVTADRLTALRPVPVLAAAAGPAGRAVPLSPRLAACCDITMGVTMGYLLVVMLR
jgi:hypothetical protein